MVDAFRGGKALVSRRSFTHQQAHHFPPYHIEAARTPVRAVSVLRRKKLAARLIRFWRPFARDLIGRGLRAEELRRVLNFLRCMAARLCCINCIICMLCIINSVLSACSGGGHFFAACPHFLIFAF